MKLILIRHLPTEWNQNGILQGSRDIPILKPTVAVKAQISQNKQELMSQGPFDLVLMSELCRTRQTAEAYGITATSESLLNELNFGEFEGKPKSALQKNQWWITNPRSLVLGESLLRFEQRIIRFLQTYQEVGTILIFGHGSWIRGLISIKQTGSICAMNQVEVRNNDMIRLAFTTSEIKLLGRNGDEEKNSCDIT